MRIRSQRRLDDKHMRWLNEFLTETSDYTFGGTNGNALSLCSDLIAIANHFSTYFKFSQHSPGFCMLSCMHFFYFYFLYAQLYLSQKLTTKQKTLNFTLIYLSNTFAIFHTAETDILPSENISNVVKYI